MPKLNLLLVAASFSLLGGCSEKFDLQGRDPQEYYAAHPIENKVVTQHFQLGLQFAGNSQALNKDEIYTLNNGLEKINRHAVESIAVGYSPSLQNKKQRAEYVVGLLRKAGFTNKVDLFSQRDIPHNKIVVDIAYAAVIPPDCPDWKKSPVTTYSNMPAANWGCAATVNLGLMVDNPRDLERGRDAREHSVERAAKAFSDYKTGNATAAAVAPASSSTSTTSQ